MASGLDLLRVWYGPLPAGFCHFILLVKGTLGNTGPFVVSGIVIMKFLYICIWKRFRTIEDDLIKIIIVLTSYFFGFLMVLTKSLAPGKPTYNTICCTGVYKSSYDLMEKKIPTEICFLIPILICQILTPIIQWQKNKLNNLKNNQSVMPRLQRSSTRTQSLDDNLTTNQNIPNLENLAFYFMANIFFILAVITIGLANG